MQREALSCSLEERHSLLKVYLLGSKKNPTLANFGTYLVFFPCYWHMEVLFKMLAIVLPISQTVC